MRNAFPGKNKFIESQHMISGNVKKHRGTLNHPLPVEATNKILDTDPVWNPPDSTQRWTHDTEIAIYECS